jgi:hypothetical protein
MSVSDIVAKILGSNGSTTAAVTTRGTKGAIAIEVVDASGTQITNFGGSLIPGSATEAKQDVGNTSLATLAGAVSGTEMQIDVLTMPTVAVTGTFWQATQPVSGTFWQATQPVSGTFWQATQPVSGTVTANAGTNLNTSLLALDSTVAKDASLSTINTSINTLLKPANTLAAVTTVSTVTNLSQMGGVAIALNTGTRSAGTQRVTIATDDLVTVTGAVTVTGTVDVATMPTVTVAATDLDIRDLDFHTDTVTVVPQGGALSVSATDLDIRDLTSASDSVAAVQSGTWNITNISGTISLPTGASTGALQTTGNTSLSTIATRTTSIASAVYLSGGGPITNGIVIFGQFGGNPKEFALDTNGAITEVSASAIKTAVEKIDDAVSGAGFNITQLGGTNITMDSGVTGAGVQRVVLATNVALPTGSNAIGKLAANSGVDIGDVDVPTLGGQAPTYGAGAVAAGTLRVTHASDDPVNVSLDEIETTVDATNDLLKTQVKPVAVSTYDGTWVQNLSFTEALIVGGAHNVLKVVVYNSAASERFLQFHNDVDGVVADGTAPKLQYLVPSKSQIILGPEDLGQNGIHFSIGISATQSTIHGSYADATRGIAGDLRVDVNYI